MVDYYLLDPSFTEPRRLSKERSKARQLRASTWWQSVLHKGICHYCGQRFEARRLTMDHIVPLARGGTSSKGNIVPACQDCNRKKGLQTPAEEILNRGTSSVITSSVDSIEHS